MRQPNNPWQGEVPTGNEWPPGGLDDPFPYRRGIADALDVLPLPSLLLAGDGSAMAANNEWALLSGMPAEASRGEGWLGALEPLDRVPLRRLLAGAAAACEPGTGDFRLASPDGGQWSRWWWRPGAPGQLVVCVAGLDQPVPRDSVPLPRAHQRPPWRLVRRSEFVNLVARALRRSRWTGAVVAVIAGDLNALRAAVGSDDRAVLAAASQVLAAGRPAAAAAVVSHDEFAVLCDDLGDPGEASRVAVRMRESMRLPAGVMASGIAPLSTGVALASADDTAEALIARACRAMYSARSAEHAAVRQEVLPAATAAALADLSTALVNRLFGVGLTLASASSQVSGPAGAQLQDAVDEVDAIINDVRAAVFASRFGPAGGTEGG